MCIKGNQPFDKRLGIGVVIINPCITRQHIGLDTIKVRHIDSTIHRSIIESAPPNVRHLLSFPIEGIAKSIWSCDSENNLKPKPIKSSELKYSVPTLSIKSSNTLIAISIFYCLDVDDAFNFVTERVKSITTLSSEVGTKAAALKPKISTVEDIEDAEHTHPLHSATTNQVF